MMESTSRTAQDTKVTISRCFWVGT